MKKKLCAALVAMVLATAAFAEKTNFPSYLDVKGTKVKGYTVGLPEELVIPDGVKEIDDGAFRDCTSLKSVTIPSGVKKIGDEVFYGCKSLVSVTIPSSVKQISEGGRSLGDMSWIPGAFDGCTSLKEIQFGGTVAQWKAVRGSDELTRRVICIRCSDGFIGVKELPEYLEIHDTEVRGYTGKVPTDVIIPEGVTEIGYEAFCGCDSLESVTIPSSVKKIGRDAFYGCTSLKEIRFSGTTAQWKALYGTADIPVSFIRCSNGNIGIADVPSYLKMHGTKITGYNGKVPANVVIPEGVTEIGNGAFRDCTSLVSVTIPASVTKIPYDAFDGCPSLKEIQFKGTKAQWEAIKGSDEVKAPYICFSDGYIGVKDVPKYLKMSGTEVTGYNGKVPANLVIPEGVTVIRYDAFKNCTSLESVTIPASVTYASSAFVDCTYLERVTIADGMTSISSKMFSGCTSLKSVSIPGSVKEIGDYAFSGCAGLTSVSIPSSTTEIGEGVFNGCTSLVSVNIVNGVTEIGSFAFRNCKSLASVMIPEGVTSIGGGAFSGCAALKNVVIPASVTGIYTAEIPTHNGELLLGAFEGCTSLASVTIPSGVTAIYAHTFKGCTSLRSVTIPRGVTGIGDNAFSDCKSLMSVVIPRSVTEIGQNAFSKCSPNLKVQYDGTKAQWGAISKGKNYYFPTLGTFVVQCTDGVLTEK